MEKRISVVLTNHTIDLLSAIIIFDDRSIKCVNVDNGGNVFEWNNVRSDFLDTYANDDAVFTCSETGRKISFREIKETLNILQAKGCVKHI